MKTLTIFTPTYNRANLLSRAYESLKKQTFMDFLWLIIDDGSNDGTEQLVEKWRKENKIEIEYYKKINGGKHSAYNFALEKISTKYVVIALDSDDYFTSNAIEVINNNIKTIDKDEVGIVTLCRNEDTNENQMKKVYDVDILNHKSLKWALSNNKFDAECVFIFRTDYIRNFKYPEYENESFFTEAYTYYQMDKPMKWIDEELCIREYREGGLTKSIFSIFYNNPRSWYEYNRIRMLENKSIMLSLKYTVYYISFGILSGEKIFCKNFIQNLKLVILFPFGFLGAIYIKKRK